MYEHVHVLKIVHWYDNVVVVYVNVHVCSTLGAEYTAPKDLCVDQDSSSGG